MGLWGAARPTHDRRQLSHDTMEYQHAVSNAIKGFIEAGGGSYDPHEWRERRIPGSAVGRWRAGAVAKSPPRSRPLAERRDVLLCECEVLLDVELFGHPGRQTVGADIAMGEGHGAPSLWLLPRRAL